ncbi:MAG: septum formation initiator family protein [Clostridiales bacterium]|nr:septum formation initiator family protein [Clostridiales bacterium]
MRRRAAFRKKQNRFGMFLVITVVIMLLLVVAVKSVELQAKEAAYNTQEAALEEQVAKEEARAEELEEYKKYTQTKKYAEEVAKDKLGLVYEGEIIFKSEN